MTVEAVPDALCGEVSASIPRGRSLRRVVFKRAVRAKRVTIDRDNVGMDALKFWCHHVPS